eukprot:6205733-Pleurochrysis_carterae.AAC.3
MATPYSHGCCALSDLNCAACHEQPLDTNSAWCHGSAASCALCDEHATFCPPHVEGTLAEELCVLGVRISKGAPEKFDVQDCCLAASSSGVVEIACGAFDAVNMWQVKDWQDAAHITWRFGETVQIDFVWGPVSCSAIHALIFASDTCAN